MCLLSKETAKTSLSFIAQSPDLLQKLSQFEENFAKLSTRLSSFAKPPQHQHQYLQILCSNVTVQYAELIQKENKCKLPSSVSLHKKKWTELEVKIQFFGLCAIMWIMSTHICCKSLIYDKVRKRKIVYENKNLFLLIYYFMSVDIHVCVCVFACMRGRL